MVQVTEETSHVVAELGLEPDTTQEVVAGRVGGKLGGSEKVRVWYNTHLTYL